MGDNIFDSPTSPETAKAIRDAEREAFLRKKSQENSTTAPVSISSTALAPKAVEPPSEIRSGPAGKDFSTYVAPVKPYEMKPFTPGIRPSEGPDIGLEDLRKERSDVSSRLEEAKKALETSKNPTSQEKLAMALVSLLPALVGGGIGASLGGISSSAGIAGGLQGSEKGLGILNQGIKERADLARKDLESETGNLKEAQHNVLQRQLANTDYGRKNAGEDWKFAQEAAQKTSELGNHGGIQAYLKNLENAGSEKNARIKAAAELEAAQMHANAAKAEKNPNEKTDLDFSVNYDEFKKLAEEYAKTIKEHGTVFSTDANAASKQKTLPPALMEAYLKVVSPDKVPRSPAAIMQAVEQRLPYGYGTRVDVTKGALQTLLQDVENRASQRGLVEKKTYTGSSEAAAPGAEDKAAMTSKKYGF